MPSAMANLFPMSVVVATIMDLSELPDEALDLALGQQQLAHSFKGNQAAKCASPDVSLEERRFSQLKDALVEFCFPKGMEYSEDKIWGATYLSNKEWNSIMYLHDDSGTERIRFAIPWGQRRDTHYWSGVSDHTPYPDRRVLDDDLSWPCAIIRTGSTSRLLMASPRAGSSTFK
eukprot:CAMPEP_0173229364 /NCGR_PEP_ID=MMETSP1142-20121109/7086_1 /TAXON_ID=483371 /ORGANISM="non described non described, Strain CCMP2298" /LENGTH=173 /DNA_ID=CAMNT_0014158199 /DNA_START=82 /DNA_END=603 /DNA_ORIENTATION=-